MLNASLVMITTNCPNPDFACFEVATSQAEGCSNEFISERILSVDMFDDGEKGEDYFKRYEDRGWRVIFGKAGGRRGMVNNQLRGLAEAKSEWVLTCEDDTFLLKIPSPQFIETAEKEHGIGFIVYNAGTHLRDFLADGLVKYINDRTNYISIEDDCLLLKDRKTFDNYRINFPALITRKDDLLQLHSVAEQMNTGKNLEVGLSMAWEKVLSHKKIAIYLSKHVMDLDTISHQDLHDLAFLSYHNNNPELRHGTLKNKQHIWI